MSDESIRECPKCGEEMVERENGSTGETFWGCPMYPQCDGTRRIHQEPEHPGYPGWAREP